MFFNQTNGTQRVLQNMKLRTRIGTYYIICIQLTVVYSQENIVYSTDQCGRVVGEIRLKYKSLGLSPSSTCTTLAEQYGN